MRRAAFCALALATVLVQVVLVDGLRLPGGSVPDIALVLVVTAGVTQGPVTGMLTGFAAGLGLDLAPPGGYLIGASALIFCLIGYGCGRLSFRLEHSVPGRLAVAAIAVGAGETAQAAAGLIAPGSGVTIAAVRSGLLAAVLYDVLLCAVLLSIAAVMRARPWVRPSAVRAARSAGQVGLAGMEARTGTAPWRTSSARDPRAYAPRSYAGAGWDARAYAANLTERKAGQARGQRPAWRAIAAREHEVPLRLGTNAHEDRRVSSRPGGGRGGSSGPRLLGPGRGRGIRRRAPRPDRGDSSVRKRQHSRQPSGTVRLRPRARQPGAVALSWKRFERRLFRRRTRICRRVPRLPGARPARRRATNGRAGGLR